LNPPFPEADISLRRNIGRDGPLPAARTRSKNSNPFAAGLR
jgi:hypothetical protein